ncbi:adenylate/guanylate cyclase domain-containing protein [candidate division KSB1 bacterium]|nr:adenylate/guanylate cyclase domain-containing protein [candidate division KSB1 bacterium]
MQNNIPLTQQDVSKLREYAEKRQASVLVIMFTDIEDSTVMWEERGNQFQSIIDQHNALLLPIVKEYQGTHIKNIGDSILAVFSLPSKAVLCSLKMQEAIFASQLGIHIRIGMDMGEVIVENHEMDVFGRFVNRASRIESLAEPDHILVTETVQDSAVGALNNSHINWHQHGYVKAKGIKKYIKVYEPYDVNVVASPMNLNIPWLESPVQRLLAGALETGPFAFDPSNLPVDVKNTSPVVIEKIMEFWQKDESIFEQNPLIMIEGTISQYAPMIIGNPLEKRQLHWEFRESLSQKHPKEELATINTMLAYTAGQMVWRLENGIDRDWIYLGLYQGIVRNSIPVFISQEYYNSIKSSVFSKESPCTSDAQILGKVKKLPESFISNIIENNEMGDFIRPRIFTDVQSPVYCIIVDGHDTFIKFKNRTRYLDGDIWIAIEVEKHSFFLSRFCDLSDMNDIKGEAEKLKSYVLSKYPHHPQVIFQFDQQQKLFSGFQTIELDHVRKIFIE